MPGRLIPGLVGPQPGQIMMRMIAMHCGKIKNCRACEQPMFLMSEYSLISSRFSEGVQAR